MLWNSLIGNWIINLPILFCEFNIILSQICNLKHDSDDFFMPLKWPCQWNNGTIPFMYNFYSMSNNRKRLISLVSTAHRYLEARSCLKFEEHDPRRLANNLSNFTYIYYTFSEALESCCLKFYKNSLGRRSVLISPICRMPGEIVHATLHGLGVVHKRHDQFNEFHVKSVLFPFDCDKKEQRLDTLIKDTVF